MQRLPIEVQQADFSLLGVAAGDAATVWLVANLAEDVQRFDVVAGSEENNCGRLLAIVPALLFQRGVAAFVPGVHVAESAERLGQSTFSDVEQR